MITVLETSDDTAAILAAEPAEQSELLRRMLRPMQPMYRFAPVEVDLVEMHGLSFGFPLDRDQAQCREGLELLGQAKAWQRLQQGLDEGLAELERANPDLEAPDITVMLTLGDPGDEHFVNEVLGLGAFGGISGEIAITLWPHPENLERLPATGVHELHHNLRYRPGGVVWNPETVTVGEHVVAEGLADAFARQLYGDLGHARMALPHLADDAVLRRVVEGLEVTGMQNFTAWVIGDPSARRFGGEPVGLPTGAGYAAGYRLVDAWMRVTGKSAAQGLTVDSREVIDIALPELGLG